MIFTRETESRDRIVVSVPIENGGRLSRTQSAFSRLKVGFEPPPRNLWTMQRFCIAQRRGASPSTFTHESKEHLPDG